jgi:AcrR family transcriptional regulator
MDTIQNIILDKAQIRFDRFGFQKTTMDEISRDCKMSKRTLYEHFQDKKTLYESLIEREAHKDLAKILSHMGNIADPLERLLQLLRTSISYFSEDVFLTRLMKNDNELLSSIMIGKSHLLITDHLLKMITGIITEGKAQGSIRADVDDEVAAYIGLRLFQAFSFMRTITFDSEKESRGFYIDALVNFFHNALVNK